MFVCMSSLLLSPFSFRFPYLRNPTHTCLPDDEVDLLVLVASAVGHTDRRAAIRATWGRKDEAAARRARVVFMLGRGEAEDGDEEDVLQEDFVDSYHNLTIKTMMGLKWAAVFCPQAKFLLKTDDDIFVNLPLLTDEIRGRTESFANITGCLKLFIIIFI